MKRCKKCHVPISGPISKCLSLLGVKPSQACVDLCTKCEPAHATGKYECQLCGRMVNQGVALSHVKAEEYLLELIRKDHPEWKETNSAGDRCLDYYRNLVNKAEI